MSAPARPHDRDPGRLRPGPTGGVHRLGRIRRGQRGGAEAAGRGSLNPPRVPDRSTRQWSEDRSSGNCSVKPWSRTSEGFALMAPEQPTGAPTSTSIGTAGRAETETRGVGTMWSVGQQRKGISRPGEHPRPACPGVVQPPRRWISGNTDAVWLALEGGCPTDRSSTG